MSKKKNEGKFTHSDFQQIIDIMNEDNEKKYYVPTVEEFHVGFEYEKYCGGPMFQNWQKIICERDYADGKEDVMVLPSDSDQVRVKYLDKEDIEALGWESTDPENARTPFKRGDWWLYFDAEKLLVTIQGSVDKDNEGFDATFIIKNKFLLKLIMEMVGIK